MYTTTILSHPPYPLQKGTHSVQLVIKPGSWNSSFERGLSGMLKSILIFTVIFFFAASTQAAETGTSSQIKHVTIYLKGARVERTASSSLVPGNNEIVFEGLSNFLDESSIEVHGAGNATILSVNYRINYLKMQQQTELAKRLQFSLDSANLKLEYLNNQTTVLDQEMQLLQSNYKMGVNEKTQFADDVEEWLQRYHKKVLEIKNEVTKLKLEQKSLRTLSYSLQNELQQANSSKKEPSGEIVVKVSSTSYGKADFKFDYYVPTASWQPLYSMRAENTTDPLKLDYDAMVSQTSGEIWKDVKISLSTANPLLGGNKPDLYPWYLNILQMVDYTSFSGAVNSMDARGLAGAVTYSVSDGQYNNTDSVKTPDVGGDEFTPAAPDADIKTISKPEEMGSSFANTTITQSQINVSFDIDLEYTIAPDGTPQQVKIQQSTLQAIYEYAAAPKLDNDAFLIARATGWEDANLLPGTANLYYEGAYIGKSYINPSVTNDTLNLSFGRDKKINIERKLLRDFSKKSFLGKNKTQNFVYEISLKNTKNIPLAINVEDQIPVSQNKEIEVTVKDVSKADYDIKTGKLIWKLNMQPNEVKKLKIEFSVKFPKNKVISGL